MVVGIVCPIHGYIEGDHCPYCHKDIPLGEGPNVQVFKPMWYNDICERPIWVTSKRQLREECKKHNVIAARLL